MRLVQRGRRNSCLYNCRALFSRKGWPRPSVRLSHDVSANSLRRDTGHHRQRLRMCKPATSAVKFAKNPYCMFPVYTRACLDRVFERDGQALRSDWERSPLSHSLPEVLRTVGWYVDDKKAQLKKISRRGETLSVCYTGPLGTQRIETFTLVQIYDMWVHLYKRRKGNIKIEPGFSPLITGDV